MCNKNKKRSEENEIDSDSDDSDVSMSDSDENQREIESSNDEEEVNEDPVGEEEEEEDEVIKAIRSAAEKKRDHPPIIHCEDFITDISFHPERDLLAVATIVGDIVLYKYTNEENTIVRTFEVHTKACRDIEFSGDGKSLFSVSKDKNIMISDVESGKLVRFFDEAHEGPIYCLLVIDENIFATGKYKLVLFITLCY